jgi:hypothetical protein
MLRRDETALPISKEVITIVNEDFLFRKLIVVKKNTHTRMTGIV